MRREIISILSGSFVIAFFLYALWEVRYAG